MIEFEETYRKMRTLVKERYFEALLRETFLENDYEAEVFWNLLKRSKRRSKKKRQKIWPALSVMICFKRKRSRLQGRGRGGDYISEAGDPFKRSGISKLLF